MFTLFFAGKDFAPGRIIDGRNIQDYLQGHFRGAVSHLACRIKKAGDVLDDIVFWLESMNEPPRGLIGHEGLFLVTEEQALKKGTAWVT